MKKNIFKVLLIILTTVKAFATPIINMDMEKNLYKVNDSIEVNIEISDNNEFKALGFDLIYDKQILVLESIENGNIVTPPNDDLLYAVADGNLILSYASNGPMIYRDGIIVKLKFRVIGQGEPGEKFNFYFGKKILKKNDNSDITAEWLKSSDFEIGKSVNNSYIRITNPKHNSVVFDPTININTEFTPISGGTVILENMENDYKADTFMSDPGYGLNTEIMLVNGQNRITATLFTELGEKVSSSRILVNRSTDQNFIKIINPVDHELFNSDMVDVNVSSKFQNVLINGIVAEKTGENDNFYSRVWLKEGFNKITAQTIGDSEEIYKDEIQIYYRKDESIFSILTPLQGSIIKTDGNSYLSITGEISSRYNDDNTENNVSYDVIHHPQNPLLSSRYLLKDQPADIRDSSILETVTSTPYIFQNLDPLDIEGLETGEIEIKVYKNKVGDKWESLVHRFLYVDNRKLEINLIQPHLYSRHYLDTRNRIEQFNGNPVFENSNITLLDNSTFRLKKQDTGSVNEVDISNVADIVRTSDGSVYLLSNNETGMRLYKKALDSTEWIQVLKQENKYGYDMCVTPMGILLGVSNLFSNNNSGLYLFEEGKLTNINIENPIPYVQFIENHNGSIYLYGNDYSYIYTFELHSIQRNKNGLKSLAANRIPFNNDLFITDFNLSSDAKTAVLTTSEQTFFYQNLNGTGFSSVDFDSDNQYLLKTQAYYGEYDSGNFNCYFLINKDAKEAYTVMENKETNKLLLTSLPNIDINGKVLIDFEDLTSVGFNNNQFDLLYKIDGGFRLNPIRVFFNSNIPVEVNNKIYNSTLDIKQTDISKIFSYDNKAFIKIEGDTRLLTLYDNYMESGELNFDYINKDIDKVYGLSFMVDPVWIEGGNISIKIAGENGDIISNSTLKDLINKNNVTNFYNIDKKMQEIHIDLSKENVKTSININIYMSILGDNSPEISDLVILNKIPVRIIKNGSEKIILPIKGFITDPSVKKVRIKEFIVNVENDGSFTYNYPINSNRSEIEIEISCISERGTSASVKFVVEILESENGLNNISFSSYSDEINNWEDGDKILTSEDIILVSGQYYGLIGATVGYEVYNIDSNGKLTNILSRGLLQHNIDQVWSEIFGDEISGYETGFFSNQEISLDPGNQKIIIFIENPGGIRSEYTINNTYPTVQYSIPINEQTIYLTNIDIKPIDIGKQEIELNIKESSNSPYVFNKEMLLHGKIRSLNRLQEIKIKSSSPAVTFNNGEQEIYVEVSDDKTFIFELNINLPEGISNAEYDINFVPRDPVFNHMKSVLKLKVNKDFENSYIVPDFSPMELNNWSESEKYYWEKPIYIKLDRYIPENNVIHLLLNFYEKFSGTLVRAEGQSNIYKIINNNKEVLLKDIKLGKNRLQWDISYNLGKIISSSNSGRAGMNDFFFSFVDTGVYIPTSITFPIDKNIFYNEYTERLPGISIKKDSRTDLTINLNNKQIWNSGDSGDSEDDIVDLPIENVIEGLNKVVISTTTKNGDIDTKEFYFYFDSKYPEASVKDYKYDNSFQYLSDITISVTEANLANVILIKKDSEQELIIDGGSIIYHGNNIFLATWTNLEKHLLNPSETSLKVIIKDQTNKEIILNLNNVTLKSIIRPEDAVVIPIELNQFNPEFKWPNMSNELGYKEEPFPLHTKFMTPSIYLTNTLINKDSLLMERHSDIFLGKSDQVNNGFTISSNGKAVIRSNNKIVLKPGFKLIKSGKLDISVKDINQPVIKKFSNIGKSSSLSFGFWYRFEQENYYNKDEQYRKILTIYSKNDETVYLAYKKDLYKRLYLIKENNLTSVKSILLGDLEPIVISDKDDNDWNPLALTVTNERNGEIAISIGSNKIFNYNNLSNNIINEILTQDAKYYFGSELPENSGHYSIASPFYIHRLIHVDEIGSLSPFNKTQLIDFGQKPRRYYSFNSKSQDIGINYSDLRVTGKDYFKNDLNIDFRAINGSGSLKASSNHENFLEKVAEGGVIFKGSEGCTTVNLDVKEDGQNFKLIRQDQTSRGRYYFAGLGFKPNLTNSKWYSVSGHVNNLFGGEAKIVLRINGEEQSIPLTKGDFHFVYNNTQDNLPESAILYIETDTDVSLSKNMSFNYGNYVLPFYNDSDIEASSAKTIFNFEKEGTIEFWYKPFLINKRGYSDFSTIIFDSEFLQIGTLANGSSDAAYYSFIKNEDGTIFKNIISQVPVNGNWQHIQLSYSLSDNGINDQVHFYIDGSLVGVMEGKQEGKSIPIFGTMKGLIPTTDNLSIGSDLSMTQYAEGFIDNFEISHLFDKSTYEDMDPLTYNYMENDRNTPSKLLIKLKSKYNDLNIKNIEYNLKSRYNSINITTKPETLFEHGFNVAGLPSDLYTLTLKAKINGKNYLKKFNFTRNKRPGFYIENITPVVVSGVSSNVEVILDYKDKVSTITNDLHYSGFIINLNYSYFDQDSIKTFFVVQDFIEGDKNNWIIKEKDAIEWSNYSIIDGYFPIQFTDIKTSQNISCEIKSFYFREFYKERITNDSLTILESCEIPLAELTAEPVKVNDMEYKIKISTGTGSSNSSENKIKDLSIYYYITEKDQITQLKNGNVNFDDNGVAELYYDNILDNYGDYTIHMNLVYNDSHFGNLETNLKWIERKGSSSTSGYKRLSINEFTLLHVDTDENLADIYVEYDQDALEDSIIYRITYQESLKSPVIELKNGILSSSRNNEVIKNVKIPAGESTIKLSIHEKYNEDTVFSKKLLQITNDIDNPSVIMTNSVSQYIGYNNVFFSWKGQQNGVFKDKIEYSYSFDNRGWSSYSNQWRQLELFDLEEGVHNLKIKSRYNNKESAEQSISFFVDINSPLFNNKKISVTDIFGEDGVRYAVNIIGSSGAINDVSLAKISCNGVDIVSNSDGSFFINQFPLTVDGINKIKLSAEDKVGNLSEYNFEVENNITESIYPLDEEKIKYAPLTYVGKLNSKISSPLKIYISDKPFESNSNYREWKEATINQDRIFFVEDLAVTPGTDVKEAVTDLTMAIVLDSGKVFYRNIPLKANRLKRPIDMIFSTHTVEGNSSDVAISIDCKADIENISSWSIDFNGDGVYDDVVLKSNASLSNNHSWTHSYSSLGQVNPRVRVITESGQYFSVDDQIIIHEKFRPPSTKIIKDPISMDSLRLNRTENIFVLAGTAGNYRIDKMEIRQNEQYITSSYSIDINSMALENPGKIKIINEELLLIIGNNNDKGYIRALKADKYNNFLPVDDFEVITESNIKDAAISNNSLLITFVQDLRVAKLPILNGLPVTSKIVYITPNIPNSSNIGPGSNITGSMDSILISDAYNKRILVLNRELEARDSFGEEGINEGEFIKPDLIKAYENRIFVYDKARKDIQVFDRDFANICIIGDSNGTNNYLKDGFFNELSSISVISTIRDSRLYYSLLLLSKSTGSLSLLELPQWQELRATVRNNKLVFLKDRELYIAKVSGSDLSRVLSTKSIPRIEGTVDYPAFSPDGRQIVFTSRKLLYSGDSLKVDIEDQYSYNNLYTVNSNGSDLVKIPLSGMENFEIERPVFNSNGTKIVFSAKSGGKKWQIYEYDQKTGGIKSLFNTSDNARFPYYSPDDKYIVFTSDYDRDEEIQIVNISNPDIRIPITSNNVRDSYPVWNSVYPNEISNPDLDIRSKIAFISERNFDKKIYNTYILHSSESDIRVVNRRGEEFDKPDTAAECVSEIDQEADYPSYSGDGKSLIYESYNGVVNRLKKHLFTIEDQTASVVDLLLPKESFRPSGMKNKITDFIAEPVSGNNIQLSWDRYTDTDVPYIVSYRIKNSNNPVVNKMIFNQSTALLKGLKMGVEYQVQISISENDEIVTSSLWKDVQIPEVASIPVITIDEDNPYLVKLEAWKPDAETLWYFSWIIDNQEVSAGTSHEFQYEFSTSGLKTIILKADNGNSTKTTYSEPVIVNIKSDLNPVIEYVLAEDSSYIELNAENSTGNKVNWSTVTWQISGPGQMPLAPVTGSKVIIPLEKFEHKINVNMKMSRIAINGQSATDTIERNMICDLDYKDVKSVITYENDIDNPNYVTFSGANSLGNIDWFGAQWKIFANGTLVHQENGLSSFAYLFPESGSEIQYSVSLTVRRINNGLTETTSSIVSIRPQAIKPVIDYEILTLKDGDLITGAKILFSCSNSQGSNIDYAQTTWNVPVAGAYGEQPTQVGPTAIYNLFGIQEKTIMEISLTMFRRNGTDVMTVTKQVELDFGDIPKTEININKTLEKTDTGAVLTLDALSSTGPNINWEKTVWLVNGDQIFHGPLARISIPESAEDSIISYICTISPSGQAPIVKEESFRLKASEINPFITYNYLYENNPNTVELTVVNTEGINIDWDKTQWQINDGNENVITRQGATINHSFPISSETKEYILSVNMYFKGSGKPYTERSSIIINGEDLTPVIEWNKDDSLLNNNLIQFNALSSKGSNIDWSQCKWNFGDSSESAFGGTVSHVFPPHNETKVYNVSLTIVRKNSSGASEISVSQRDIVIGANIIVPYIEISDKLPGDFPMFKMSVKNTLGENIDWERTTWSIHDGNEGIIQKKGAEIIHTFSKSGQSYQFPVSVEMYLKGNGYPFSIETVIRNSADILELEITDEKIDNHRYTFNVNNLGLTDIDLGNAKWMFSDTGETITGKRVEHIFPVHYDEKAYSVNVTISRNSSNGNSESKMITKKIIIPGSYIEPGITIDKIGTDGDMYELSVKNTTSDRIDWGRTTWFIDNGNGVIDKEKGATFPYTFIKTEQKKLYNIQVIMYLEGSSFPFNGSTTFTTEADPLIVQISAYNVESSTGENIYEFSTERCLGANISKYKWGFDNGSITDIGELVSHEFPISSELKEYRVYLTLERVNKSGKVESETGYIDISVPGSAISPKIVIDKDENNADLYHMNISQTIGGDDVIDRARTQWFIDTGNGQILEKTGSLVSHQFDATIKEKRYHILVAMYLKGSSYPFEANTVITTEADPLVPVIKSKRVDSLTGTNMFEFTAEDSLGTNIDFTKTKWTFENTGETLYGKTVSKDFPISEELKKYRVSLTVERTLNNNSVESETTLLDLSVQGNTIIPIIEMEKLEGNNRMYSLNVQNSTGTNIDWNSTQWTIDNGNEGIVQKTGSNITYTFPTSTEEKKYQIQVKLFLEGSSYPFEGRTVMTKAADPLVVEIISNKTTSIVDRNVYEFSADNCLGENIDFSKAKWTFEHNGAIVIGKTVSQEFPLSNELKKYRVYLTIERTANNGQIETETGYLDVSVGGNIIVPEIKMEPMQGDMTMYRLHVLDSTGVNIDWNKTIWSIHDGNEGIIQKNGSEVTYTFPISSESYDTPVSVQMFLKGCDFPFVGHTTVASETTPFNIIIEEEKLTSHSYRFKAIIEGARNVDQSQLIWKFSDTGETASGQIVEHKFPVNHDAKKYSVSLSGRRTSSNGSTESRTDILQLPISALTIKPAIREPASGSNTMLLSVEDTIGEEIDWERTHWYIDNGNGVIEERTGANTTYTFVGGKNGSTNKIKVNMFLKGSGYPFTAEKNVKVTRDELTINFSMNKADTIDTVGAGKLFKFDAGATIGSNIDWNTCRWTFGDSSDVQSGRIVYHEYPVSSTSMTYQVSLTINRRLPNGLLETESFTKNTKITEDKVIPIVNFSFVGSEVVLKSNTSSGLGIDWNKTTWYIEAAKGNETTAQKTSKIYGSNYALEKPAAPKAKTNGSVVTTPTLPKTITGQNVRTSLGNAYQDVWVVLQLNRSKADGSTEYFYVRQFFDNPKEKPPKKKKGICIICTELYEQGYMSEQIHLADEAFGKYLETNDPKVMPGYQFMARPIVVKMQESVKFTEMVNVFAEPWSIEMAYRMGYLEKGDIRGAIVMAIGIPICRVVGHMLLLKWYHLISIFTLLTLFVIFTKSTTKKRRIIKKGAKQCQA